jgi:hypothetical protein
MDGCADSGPESEALGAMGRYRAKVAEHIFQRGDSNFDSRRIQQFTYLFARLF